MKSSRRRSDGRSRPPPETAKYPRAVRNGCCSANPGSCAGLPTGTVLLLLRRKLHLRRCCWWARPPGAQGRSTGHGYVATADRSCARSGPMVFAPFAQNPDPQASAECTSIRITRSTAHGEKPSRQSRRRFSARGGGKYTTTSKRRRKASSRLRCRFEARITTPSKLSIRFSR